MAMNISMLWPIVLIVISSVCYQICAKSSPSFMHPLAVLVIAYAVGTVGCAILYMVLNRGGNLLAEIKSSNKIPYLIGICLIGLEVGTIYMYKVGWAVNTGYIVHSSLIAVGLLIAGYVLFREPITVNKVIGIVICMIGLYFINK